VIFFSSFMAVLYHLGIMHKVVYGMAWVMKRSLGTSGAESLSAAANIFVGQTEAPLLIRPYISKMTDSEILAVMVGGMATIAGGVLAAYVGILSQKFPDIAGHLMAASIMSWCPTPGMPRPSRASAAASSPPPRSSRASRRKRPPRGTQA
jgi:CNT family concentrative nucleoside transporter